jgi:hypothetical protein
MENKSNNSGLKAAVVVLAILFLGSVGYIFKLTSENKETVTSLTTEKNTLAEELKGKIDTDLLALDKKEAVLSKKEKELSNLETLLNQKESDISDEIRDFEIRLQETKEWEAELLKLSEEINNWESLHWKF